MSLLAAKCHDPATAVTWSTAASLAMTAFDTTNLRVTFTVPTSGNVLVRVRGMLAGGTTQPGIHIGVLNGSAVVRRMPPMMSGYVGNAAYMNAFEGMFTVTGLSPAAPLTWDAAYGVEYAVAGTTIRAGGPNDQTANNAWGGLLFEVWSA